jgi:hypothetical protein
MMINGYCHHYERYSSFFFGIHYRQRNCVSFNDVLVNEDEIVELEVDEGPKNIN